VLTPAFSGSSFEAETDAAPLLAQFEAAHAEGRLLDALDAAQAANRYLHDGELESRLIRLRADGVGLIDSSRSPQEWPPPYPDLFPNAAGLPEVSRNELSVETLGSGITRHGALVIRGLFDEGLVSSTIAGIDRAFVAYDEWADQGAPPSQTAPWFERFTPSEGSNPSMLPRAWMRGTGGIWLADSPRMTFDLLEIYQSLGLDRLIGEYFGERPAFSVEKATLRRVPVDTGSSWHQDGAFLGDGLRTVNVWVALTDCGGADSDTPALDVVPRRFDELVETGTHGAQFESFVSQAVVEREAGDAGIVRPRFSAGDALLFDDLFLHATGVSPGMTRERYAIESWFFAPSSVPVSQTPLVF
jgi:hypothetical protein